MYDVRVEMNPQKIATVLQTYPSLSVWTRTPAIVNDEKNNNRVVISEALGTMSVPLYISSGPNVLANKWDDTSL